MEKGELRKRTCCFTGHRDLPDNQKEEISRRLAAVVRRLVTEYGVRYFGVGGAVGYDTLAAEVLLAMKVKEFPHIKIILVYPFDGFQQCWSWRQRWRYERLLPRYDKVVCVSQQGGRQAYLSRDRRLVDGATYCVSYCVRNSGGTAYTVRYAKQQGLTVIELSDHGVSEGKRRWW